MKVRINLTLKLLGLFISIVFLGAYLTEIVKSFSASFLGYESEYQKEIWVQTFNNQEEENASIVIQNLFLIDLIGKLFTWVISIWGYLFYIRSSSEYKKALGFVLSLFFMRDVGISLIESITSEYFCINGILWNYLNIDFVIASWIYGIAGLIVLGLLILKLDKAVRITYLITGFFGSMLGLIAWIKFADILL